MYFGTGNRAVDILKVNIHIWHFLKYWLEGCNKKMITFTSMVELILKVYFKNSSEISLPSSVFISSGYCTVFFSLPFAS